MSVKWLPFALVGVGFVVAHAYAAEMGDAGLCEFLLDLMFLPVVVVSFYLGVRGAVVSVAVADLITIVSYLMAGLFEAQVLVTDVVLFGLIGGVIGWSIDHARTQAQTYAAKLEQAVQERTRELQARTTELATLAGELDSARRENLRRLALAAELHDDQTAEHTERVAQLACRLAHQLGLPDAEIRLLEEAAPLHDIGKLGTPDAILLKPGRLTDNERAVMQQHTQVGAKMLADSSFAGIQMAAEIALNHHEQWDGSGYPNKLAGEQIPLVARIVTVADVYDALTHARPYKRAWSAEDAIGEIHRLKGTRFDPQVVDALGQLDPQTLAGHQHAARHTTLSRVA